MNLDLSELSKEELSEYYLNAKATSALAGGHMKAHQNARKEKEYYAEICRRGMPTPEGEGTFNGKGSW